MKPVEMASCLTPHKQGTKIFLENRKEAAKAINYDFVLLFKKGAFLTVSIVNS